MLSAMNKEKINQLYFYMLIFIAATWCFPVINAINSIGIILFGLLWIAEGKWSEKWQKMLHNKIILLPAGFFLIHLVGLIYTENIGEGLNLLLDYLPFCLFPLVLATITPLTERQVFIVIGVFVLSCFLATSICLSNSLQIAFSNEKFEYDGNEFWFYSRFTRPLHINPIYLSLYVGFCVFFLGAYLLQYSTRLLFYEKTVLMIAIGYFMVVLCLLATRTALVSTILLGTVNYVFYVYKTKKRGWHLLPIILIPASLILIINTSSFLKKRFVDVKNFSGQGIAENLYERQPQQKPWKGASVRLAIWKSSVGIVENNFFTGVGTGDAQDELVKAYKSNRYIFEQAETRHNAHNQFIQTQITIGVVGLIILVAIFLLCFYKGWQQKSYFYMTFIAYIVMNCQTEALLQRPKGIVFFSLIGFIILFSFNYRKHARQEKALALKYV